MPALVASSAPKKVSGKTAHANARRQALDSASPVSPAGARRALGGTTGLDMTHLERETMFSFLLASLTAVNQSWSALLEGFAPCPKRKTPGCCPGTLALTIRLTAFRSDTRARSGRSVHPKGAHSYLAQAVESLHAAICCIQVALGLLERWFVRQV